MPANPLRRRSKLADAAKLAAADAALSYAKDRISPGSRKRGRGRALLIGGAVAAVGVAAIANRKRVAGLLGAGPSVPEPPPYTPPRAVPDPAPARTPAPETAAEPTAAAAAPAVAQPITATEPEQPEQPQPVTPAEPAPPAAEEKPRAEEQPAPETPSTPETPAVGDPAEREETQRDESPREPETHPEQQRLDTEPGDSGEALQERRDESGGWQSWSGISSRP